jgi:hypothetical protein
MQKKKKVKASESRFHSSNLIYLKLLSIVTTTTPFVILSLFFIPSYFPAVAAEKMIFSSADGNCVSAYVHLGKHCFGDYGAVILLMNQLPNPWENPNPLVTVAPLILIISKIFVFLNTLPSPGLVLVLYLGTLIYCSAYPLLHATKGLELKERFRIVSYLSIATLPVLAVIDRGNNSVWAIPFLYLGIVNLIEKNESKAILFMALAISMRPQIIIFLAIFFASKSFFAILKTMLLTIIIYAVSFSLYLQTMSIKPLLKWVDGLAQYGSGIPGDWPPSLSIARGVKVLLGSVGFSIKDASIIIFSYVLLLLVLLIIVAQHKVNGMVLTAILITPLLMLLAPVTWYYYGAYLQICIALLVKCEILSKDFPISKNFSYFFIFAIYLTLSVIYLPLRIDYNNLVQYVVPVIWLIFYLYYLFCTLLQRNSKRQAK